MIFARFLLGNKFVFAILSICVIFCVDIALGSTLDVHVYYKGEAASKASVYIDEDILLGQTDLKGILKDVNISPGNHIVVAKWRDYNGDELSGSLPFTAEPRSYTMARVDLEPPRNLGWIWQFVKNKYG